ncbi:MAG: 4Fe-4S dicluster domain-containing protein [Bacilli bacterium]|jgi:electron transport complex protein RnfC|nr:4Fe-4S dicluster domain-containing protein [Bacilli bacterium]
MKKIKLEENENIECSNKVILLDNPTYVSFSLNANGIYLPSIKKGDYVYQEEKIAIKKGNHFPIFSSVSGIVEVVDANKILIRNDFKNRVREHNIVEHSLNTYTKSEISNILFQLGIMNSLDEEEPYKILSEAVNKTLIINALQQEAYIYLQTFLLKIERKELLELMEAFLEIYNFEEILIVVPKNQELLLEEWKLCIKDSNIKMVEIEEYYSLSKTRELVRAIKKVTYKKTPAESGIIVFNVSTMLAIYGALKYRRPQIKTMIQFTGNMWKNNCYMEVRIGTSLQEAIEQLSYKRAKDILLLKGGIVSGNSININDFVIDTKALVFTAWKVTNETKQESCTRCGKCSQACPMSLHPVLIMEAISKKRNLSRFELQRCIDCGVCNYVCPSNIDIYKRLKEAKENLL